MNDLKNRQNNEILESVFKNASMAYEASGDVLKNCGNTRLYNEISKERERYRHIAEETRREMVSRGGIPREYGTYAKAMSKMGIAMRTFNDKGSRNIAKLMIRGTTMGIIDMQHAVNRSYEADETIRSDAQSLLDREQQYCNRLKRYL